MKIGFIGLGNVGAKLAGSLLRNNFDLTVRDIDENLTNSLKDLGAKVAKSPKELAEQSDLIITSLPSPEVSAEVMESEDGILNGCLLYTSPSPRDLSTSRMPSSA